MGDQGFQLTKEELAEMLQDAATNAVRASQRASIKRKLNEHVSSVEKIIVTSKDDIPRACIQVACPSNQNCSGGVTSVRDALWRIVCEIL